MFGIKNAIFLLAIFSNLSAFSRLSSIEEAHVRSNLQMKIVVEADGKSKIIQHEELTLLTEWARQALSTMNFKYPADSSQFDILKSEVHHPDGKIDSVDPTSLTRQQKPGTNQLIDDTMSMSIPFPNVQIKSTLVTETTRTTIKSIIPGNFSFEKDFEDRIYSQDTRIDFESKIPLFHEVRKDSLWEISEEKIAGEYPYQYHFRLRADYFYSVTSEEEGQKLEPTSTQIIVSNTKTMHGVFQSMASAYEAELSKPATDDFFVSALERAKSTDDFDEKINILIHALHDKTFVYYFDLRNTERRCFPRSLRDIFENKKADCKAFSLLLSKWLRELGYEAFPALVYSGKYDIQWSSLPTTTETNHAIIFCLVDGQERWIDPTFAFSTGEMIPDHILNRNAIVLDHRNVTVKKIPLPTPELSVIHNKKEIVRLDEERIQTSFLGQTKGARSVGIFSAFFGTPSETTLAMLEEGLSENTPHTTIMIEPPSVVSRKVQDLSYSACFIFNSEEFCKNQGIHNLLACEEEDTDKETFTWNIEIFSEHLKNLVKTNFQSYEQGIHLGRPRIEIEETSLEPVSIDRLPKMVHVDTPWFSFTRSFSFTKENQKLNMIEKVVYKTDRIQNAELKSPKFLAAKRAIKIGGVSLRWAAAE